MLPLGANVTKQYRGKLPQHSFMTLSQGSNIFLNNTVVSQNHNNIVLNIGVYSNTAVNYHGIVFITLGPGGSYWQLISPNGTTHFP
jgi:hypothetical protein